MGQNITIKLSDGSNLCKVEFEKVLKNRTITSSKIISLEDLIKAISENSSMVEEIVIPQNLAMILKKDNKKHYYFDFPAQKKHITVKNRAGKIIYNNDTLVPRTVFVVVPDPVTKKINPKSSIFVYAIKGTGPITKETELYTLPMYNIFDTNNICWGSYNYDFGTEENLDKCLLLHSCMYEATCNLDLTPKANYNWILNNIPGYGTGNESFVQVLKYLEDKTEYPEDLLTLARTRPF